MAKNRYQRFCTEGRNPRFFRTCLEHSSFLSQLTRKAKETNMNLLWSCLTLLMHNGSVSLKSSKTQKCRQSQTASGLPLQQYPNRKHADIKRHTRQKVYRQRMNWNITLSAVGKRSMVQGEARSQVEEDRRPRAA